MFRQQPNFVFLFVFVAFCEAIEIWFQKSENLKATSCPVRTSTPTLALCFAGCLVQNRGEPGKCVIINFNENSSACDLCDVNSKFIHLQSIWQTWVSAPVEETIKLIAAADCAERFYFGSRISGVYNISKSDGQVVSVYCDMETDGGGWTVFQRRLNGSQDFYLSWNEYKQGFGSAYHEYWLGNDELHYVTSKSTDYELRVDLEDFENTKVFALYREFRVAGEDQDYKLTVIGYDQSSTSGDSFSFHNRRYFSTKDVDNDHNSVNCGLKFKGGWWYGDPCHEANLNGLYLSGNNNQVGESVVWYQFRGLYYSLRKTEMKIRPVGFNSKK